MDRRQAADLDRHITGNYGEDQFRHDWTVTFCPECGPGVEVDDDGCCVTCGATAVGSAVEEHFRVSHLTAEKVERLYQEWLSLKSTVSGAEIRDRCNALRLALADERHPGAA